MEEFFYRVLEEAWGVPGALIAPAARAERLTAGRRAYWRERGDQAFLRVLAAFQHAQITEGHLFGTTGYGYGDVGREALDAIYAELFGGQAALVRLQIVSGTHALSLCFRAAARPGDVLVSGTGAPYDTLRPQLAELQGLGCRYMEAALGRDGTVDPEAVAGTVGEAAIVASKTVRSRGGAPASVPRVVLFLQRSRGYDAVPSRGIDLLSRIVARAREEAESSGVELITIVDNCYGEFVEDREPPEIGADLTAGSLIKNPGGGIAPTGGYVVGRTDLVRRAAEVLTAPGVGGETGPTLGIGRLLYQGLFLAPRAVAASLAGATYAAALLEGLGLPVSPHWDEERTDIIQSVGLGSREEVLAFAKGIQSAAPVDSMAVPVPAGLPGYADEVVMAAGTFVQGASIELSLDGPLRPPFSVYLQGGLYEAHLKLASILAAAELWHGGHLKVVPRDSLE